MSRRDEWNRVLAIELGDGNVAYEVIVDSKNYQVEVDLLEDTETYLHVSIAVDDGTLPAAIVPASRSFIVKKTSAQQSGF